MKQLIMAILLAATVTAAQAQITHEKTHALHPQLSVCKIEGEPDMYLGADRFSKKVTIYRTDHTVYKTITPQPFAQAIETMGASYATRYLFDNDADIEVLVQYTVNNFGILDYGMSVYNEDGSLLHHFAHSANGHVVNVNGALKLITEQPMQTPPSTEVWALPGTYAGIQKPGKETSIATTLYPNPVIDLAVLAYTLPDGVKSAGVNIFNAAGQLVQSYTATSNNQNITIRRSGLPAGVYFYTFDGGESNRFEIK